MKKKKKRNRYDFAVYLIYFFGLAFFVTGVITSFAEGEKTNFLTPYHNILAVVMLSFLAIALLLSFYVAKNERKLTISLNPPKKPNVYLMEHFTVENDIAPKLLKQGYVARSDILENKIVYVRKMKKRFQYPDKTYQLSIFLPFCCQEFTKEKNKELTTYHQKIVRALKDKESYFDILFLVIVEHNNEYLQKYVTKEVTQFYRHYNLKAFYVTSEHQLYIPAARFNYAWDAFDRLKEQILDLVYDHIIKKVKKRYIKLL